jgi:hypothetical protein
MPDTVRVKAGERVKVNIVKNDFFCDVWDNRLNSVVADAAWFYERQEGDAAGQANFGLESIQVGDSEWADFYYLEFRANNTPGLSTIDHYTIYLNSGEFRSEKWEKYFSGTIVFEVVE